MKISKRALSILLAAAALSGCSDSGASRGTQAASTTAEVTVPATTLVNELDNEVNWEEMAAIDEVDAANEVGTGPLYQAGQTAGTVHALCYYDLATTQPELAEILAQRYGGTIETEISASGSGYFEKLGVLVAAGDSPDIVRYDWMAYPSGVSRNMFTALDDWLDMDSPLWVSEKDVIEAFNYQGRHYYYPSDISTNFAIIYNRTLLLEEAMADPMDMYFSGTWDWNAFEDLIKQWAQKGDDYIGFTGGSWTSMMFANTTGIKTIDMTGTEIINNLKETNVRRTMDWLSKLKHDGYIGEGFIDPGQAFVDGKLLFLAMGLTWGYESAQGSFFNNSIEGEVAAVPFPRDPQADKYYLSSDSFGFMVPSGAKNIQGGISWILSGRIYQTDPETVAADYAKLTDTSPSYYAKCPECKHNYEENGENDLAVCPECGTARRRKFRPYYSPEQMQICADMKDPEKFGLIFDNAMGFSDDFSSILTGGEESVFDGPIYYGSSYTQVIEASNSLIEAQLEPYRSALKGDGIVR